MAITPTPEDIQYILGIHPDQIRAVQAAAEGDSSQLDEGTAKPEDTEKPPDTYQRDSSGLMVRQPAAPGPRPIAVPREPAPVTGAIPGTQQQGQSTLSSLLRTPIQRPKPPEYGREMEDRAEVDRLRTTGAGVDQIKSRPLRILSKIGDVAGSVLTPRLAEEIPGTTMHHRMLLGEAEGRVKQDMADERQRSQEENQESLEQAREDATEARNELNRIRAVGMGEKFIAGTEQKDPNSPTGWTAQTFDGTFKPYTPPQSYKPTFDQTMQDREQQADKMGLKGDDRKFYVANGHLPEPKEHFPGSGEIEFNEWKAAFRREHGRDPNANEILEYKRGGRPAGGAKGPKDMRVALSNLEKDKKLDYTKEENRFNKEFNAEKNGSNDKATLDRLTEEHNERKDEIERTYQQRLERLQSGEGVPDEENRPPAQRTTPVPERPAPKPKAGDDVGGGYKYAQQVMVGNAPAYVVGYNRQTGKVKLSHTRPQ